MSRKAFWMVLAAAVLASGFLGVTTSSGFWGGGFWHHRGKTPINWKVAGTVAYVQLAIPTATGIDNVAGILIRAVIKGIPDDGQFTVVSIGNPPGYLDQCGGSGLTVERNDMVITLADQSMIFAALDTG
jgi:hypothetical protein